MGFQRWLWTPFGVVVCFAAGCNCAGYVGPCEADPPAPECGMSCAAGEPCPSGFYCGSDGACTSECNDSFPCGGGAMCTADGHCVGGDRQDARTSCADVTVQATHVTPNVIMVVDQSGSMDADFGTGDRWNVLRDSLLAQPDGFIYALQGGVRFGLALYSAEAPDQSSEPVPGECPVITWVDPAINNYDAIQAVYGPANIMDETPTGESLDAVLDRVINVPDPSPDPTIFILATDGEPDTCGQPNPQEGQPESLAAARRAYMAGVRTYIISVGDEVSTDHLQDMANTGLGVQPGEPDAEYWVAGDDQGLRDALGEIIGGQLSCLVTLEGMIDDLSQACSGRVEINGNPLQCEDPNGWTLIDATHIELQGEACDILQSSPGVTLTATFPCGVILI